MVPRTFAQSAFVLLVHLREAFAGIRDEPGLALLEPELDLAGRAVSVLRELQVDDLPLGVLVFGAAALLVPPRKRTRSASCSIAPDSRRSDSLGSFDSRISGWRDSCDSAMTGTDSSREGLQALEISDTSCTRLASRFVVVACISWR